MPCPTLRPPTVLYTMGQNQLFQISQVRSLADSIAKSWVSFTRGVPAGIVSWVYGNIRYVKDDPITSLIKYWQLPTETLSRRTGECEDMAFLVASLMQARGYSNAHVVSGKMGPIGHVWVEYSDWGGENILDATKGAVIPKALWNAYGYTTRYRRIYPTYCVDL